jgi:hypothetical protein
MTYTHPFLDDYGDALDRLRHLDGQVVDAWISSIVAGTVVSVTTGVLQIRDLGGDEATFTVGDTELSVDQTAVLAVESHANVEFNIAGTRLFIGPATRL